jgi:hypothetical protein
MLIFFGVAVVFFSLFPRNAVQGLEFPLTSAPALAD